MAVKQTPSIRSLIIMAAAVMAAGCGGGEDGTSAKASDGAASDSLSAPAPAAQGPRTPTADPDALLSSEQAGIFVTCAFLWGNPDDEATDTELVSKNWPGPLAYARAYSADFNDLEYADWGTQRNCGFGVTAPETSDPYMEIRISIKILDTPAEDPLSLGGDQWQDIGVANADHAFLEVSGPASRAYAAALVDGITVHLEVDETGVVALEPIARAVDHDDIDSYATQLLTEVIDRLWEYRPALVNQF